MRHLSIKGTQFLFAAAFVAIVAGGTHVIPGSSQRGICSVCRRDRPLLTNGTVKIHGPVDDRCLGSRKSPQVHSEESNNVPRSPVSNGLAQPPSSHSGSGSRSRSATIDLGPLVGKVLKRIPRSSRLQVAKKFASILDATIYHNDPDSWERLFLFPMRCLLVPSRGGKNGEIYQLSLTGQLRKK